MITQNQTHSNEEAARADAVVMPSVRPRLSIGSPAKLCVKCNRYKSLNQYETINPSRSKVSSGAAHTFRSGISRLPPELAFLFAKKKCSHCGVEKERERFNRNKTTKDGFNYWCKLCVRIARREKVLNDAIAQSDTTIAKATE